MSKAFFLAGALPASDMPGAFARVGFVCSPLGVEGLELVLALTNDILFGIRCVLMDEAAVGKSYGLSERSSFRC